MPDLLITNANVYRGGGVWERASVQVRDGVIAAVGDDASIQRDSEDAVVHDAQGASVVPGLHDTHVHPSPAGTALLQIDLSGVHDAAASAETIAAFAAAHPDEPFLIGAGWYGDVYEGGFPDRWALDAIVADRPVVLRSHDGHGAWLNSLALQAAGVSDDIADPVGGRFVRNADGVLTGVLLDTAMGVFDAIVPEPPAGFLDDTILAAQARLHSVGITTWHDAAVGQSDIGPDTFDSYLALADSGSLTANVVLCQWWDRLRGFEQIAEFARRRDVAAERPTLQANTVKIMLDGMIENLTASMLEPYETPPGDTPPGETVAADANRGESFVDPTELAAIVTRLDAEGYQVHLHAVGDRAVREALDALAAARRANGATNGRHQITHLDVVHPSDLARFAELDATANVQMLWARTDTEIVERKLPLMGEERAAWHFPFGSLHRAGARIAAGSDWPVSDPNPFWAMHTGTRRVAPASDPHATGSALDVPLLPDEALPFETALDAFTTNAAWVGHLDGVTGRIAAGLAADLVVLDRDISSGEGLDVVQVVETFVGGVSVYRSADRASGL